MTDLQDLFDVQNWQENNNKPVSKTAVAWVQGHCSFCILGSSPYMSLKKLTSWKHPSKDQRTFPLVIILLILVTYLLYNVLKSLRENRCWSSLELKGFKIKACGALTAAAYLWLDKVFNIRIKRILHTMTVKNIAKVILSQIIYTIFPFQKKVL